MIRLLFPLADTLALAEHAIAAPAHHQSYAQIADGKPAGPALHWVKDDGTYLMSNGNPGLPADPTRPDGTQRHVAALGYGPGTRRSLADTDLGRDDFVEHIDLTTADDEDESVIDALRDVAAQGWECFVIDVDADRVTVGVFSSYAVAAAMQ